MKGYIYTLEVLLAISIIVGSIIFILGTAPEKSELNLLTMNQRVFEAVEYLDNKGELRALVNDDNEIEIENQLNSILPSVIKFETDICTTSCNGTNIPTNQEVIVFDYFISGYKDRYIGKRIRIWIWEKF